jgi:hypothetical protein
MVERLTNRPIKVGIEASQILYLILDTLNDRSGFSASVAEMVYLCSGKPSKDGAGV